ncbi:MAG: metalloregulator ArsR/SmtB family transcription factor [Elusimicrobiales bacterium]|nr:metalloregulator ArsR/SmtB family transcription factor [Elusimicrobiales bacterium]
MKQDHKKPYAAQAAVLKAMAHPTRLLILNSLKKRETCVCELRDLVGDDISTVSKHLLVLKNAGLVAARREGNWLHYRLTCPCVLDFAACIAALERKHV